MTQPRSDPAKHKAMVRAANRARYKAIRLLIQENQQRFDELYAQQAGPEGVEPRKTWELPFGAVSAMPDEDRRARRARQKRESYYRVKARRAAEALDGQPELPFGDGDG